MKGTISVKRCGRWAKFSIDAEANTPVTMILDELNSRETLLEADGSPAEPIVWECSCDQGVCGSCAMVINGSPRLACSAFFGEVGPDVKVEPLSKFPLVADLKVDRSPISKALSEMKIWLEDDDALVSDVDMQYTSASCMLCGCCLEVCPNYSGEGKFFGAVGMNACFRIAEQLSGSAKRERLSYFAKHGDAGCSKSLACQVVCPAKSPLSVVISRLNRERFLSVFYRNK